MSNPVNTKPIMNITSKRITFYLGKAVKFHTHFE